MPPFIWSRMPVVFQFVANFEEPQPWVCSGGGMYD